MPLSQFSGVILSGAGVEVTGTVAPARNLQGNVVPRTTPVQVHFLVVQDATRWVSGVAETMGTGWGAPATHGPGLQLGPAQAIGLSVVTKESPTPAFETFSWFEGVHVTS